MYFKSAVFFLLMLSTIEVNSQYYQHHHLWRIIEGSATTIDRYPIMAQLLLDAWDSQMSAQHCSGVVLTARHVLSTAHCFQYNAKTGKNYALPRYWQILVGSSFRSRGGPVYPVQSITQHPQFNASHYLNDVAVLRVAGRMALGARVRQATLLDRGAEVAPGSSLLILGWGLTQTGGTQPEQLQQGSVLAVAAAECRRRYAAAGALVTDAMLCASGGGGGAADGCFGDSGGPLLYKGLVAGLVSFGYSCGHEFYPGVYTKISHFTDWIVKTIYLTN